MRKTTFRSVVRFSQNTILCEKMQNRPRFSVIHGPIELKIFLQLLDTVWVGEFFLFQKILLWWFLEACTKIALIAKQAFFYGASSILTALFEGKRIKRNKKNPYPKQYLVPVKKIFSSTEPSRLKKRGQKVGSFVTLVIPIFHRRKHCENLSLA